ncbi:VOC family protein [Cellulomonas iranensis]|uniref:Phosphoglycerate mutase n=1 Tax=Cellulomonas iranensis TaxID=76862 RepID=A0ABU0GJZ9_9CELL|nr:VOC family protein [Cellulomonas iranensis]MDQ0425046.1 putative phosphoglycerate mutase [Cellulomonas iranensis]
MSETGALHHVELWVADLETATTSLGWLLERLGYARDDAWPTGGTWRRGGTYVVLEAGPDVVAGAHERRRPGLNHLAFHAGTPADVDALTAEALAHGWSLMFADRHPWAGGPDHYAAYLEDAQGFEVELVASTPATAHPEETP